MGKIGDILSILPCLRADFVETGVKPHLIVSRKYAFVLEGIDYVEPVIWDGDWTDLAGAMRDAKHRYREVNIPQMHAEGYVPKRQYPGFQLDQWARMGRLKQWGLLPLVINHEPIAPTGEILLADASESSPFPQIDDLYNALKETFPSRPVVRLSSVRLPLLADLVARYDAADLIVTIDTMHLHLSAASRTPVVALSTDKPSRWHGSSFHPRMKLMVRYGDYDVRKKELLHVAGRAVNIELRHG